ncbi:MAG: acylphosphatase [Candidatus Omnitrophota bacterium]
MKKRAHIYYSGYVQGVGFRWTAEDIANRMHLAGWVKNLSDARVEVICEGEEQKVKDFLASLKTKMQRYVSDIDIEWEEFKGEFKDFQIRFYSSDDERY